jgi:hypothetical protein
MTCGLWADKALRCIGMVVCGLSLRVLPPIFFEPYGEAVPATFGLQVITEQFYIGMVQLGAILELVLPMASVLFGGPAQIMFG